MLGLSVGLGIGTGSVISGGGGGAAVTLNPTNGVNKYSGITLSGGNLTATPDGLNYEFVRATRAASAGATQVEVTIVSNSNPVVSIEDGTQDFSVAGAIGVIPGASGTTGWSFRYVGGNVYFYNNSGTPQTPVATVNNGDKFTIQLDKTAGTIKLLLNGVQLGTTITGVSWANWYLSTGGASATTVNFGATAFTYGTNAAY